MQEILSNFREFSILLMLYTDSKSLYKYLIRLSTTDEKRLIIDIIALRESYKRKKISELI
jgi:hypothetical protein